MPAEAQLRIVADETFDIRGGFRQFALRLAAHRVGPVVRRHVDAAP
jgi:hypothetical protein